MYRAAFLAFGLYMVLSGGGLLFVDDVALNARISSKASPVLQWMGSSDESGRCHLQPPEWVPFTLIGVGIVTMLYSVALPRE
ncbi:hypothetical protein SH661x_003702 [Planctomicrobium sp. SH661]|uniref:hypothetical protein n=1 Tax=Planctomicrobium sp. SH661 TaxID=3448124 RepID=UPI003F5B7260